MKLINDLKQFMILNDFAFVNETIQETNTECMADKQYFDERLSVVNEDAIGLMFEVEHELFNQSPSYSNNFTKYRSV